MAYAAELRSFKCYYLIRPTSLLGVLYIMQPFSKMCIGSGRSATTMHNGVELNTSLFGSSILDSQESTSVVSCDLKQWFGGKSLRLHCNPITHLNLTLITLNIYIHSGIYCGDQSGKAELDENRLLYPLGGSRRGCH